MKTNEHNLIILLNDFPYRTGETFFETELDYLTDTFDGVYLVSPKETSGETSTRVLPKGIHHISIYCPHRPVLFRLIAVLFPRFVFPARNWAMSNKWKTFYAIGRMVFYYRQTAKALKKKKASFSNSLIYCYWLTLGLSGIALKKYLEKRNRNIHVISRAHGYDLYDGKTYFDFAPLQKAAVSQLDAIYPCSEYGVSYLRRLYPEFASKIKIERLGVAAPIKTNKAKKAFKRIVTCSSDAPVKRLPLFAEAFRLLCEKRDDVIWEAFGFVPDNRLLEILGERAIKNVRFHGKVPNKDVLDFYAKNEIDYFVNVSSSEGVPVSIMEAQSYGIPVIATKVGGTSEIVDDKNGMLLTKNISPKELSQEISRFLNLDEKAYLEKSEKSSISWAEKSSANTIYQSWAKRLLCFSEDNL